MRLSVFPALLAMVAVVGLVADPHTITEHLTDIVNSIGPASAVNIFKAPIEGLTKSSGWDIAKWPSCPWSSCS